MNIYHEFGHLLNRNAVQITCFQMRSQIFNHTSFINDGGSIGLALTDSMIPDPNYGRTLAQQHIKPNDLVETWGDVFGNYVAGNINMVRSEGRDMASFVTGALAPYIH